ncbi:hypothetical protein P691DRAFT_771793 [Macrolepiota fuliginosa MF-IS2]|uniref:Origin recognition complex subunit 4 n=1 Tax=Macrolepiota fuliginosa MF-IS2 TaxID=1400762 RepID=A0A9P5XKF6_9AGAR|nr:hypothetical protein P691DRAFT_771793 [Macrolepiota fuliginosa MF-IS2]
MENAVPKATAQTVSETKPDTETAASSPAKTRGRKKQTDIQESPSKRQSKRPKADQPDLTSDEKPSRVKRTYAKNLVVEVPLPPRIRSPPPPPQPVAEARDTPITPRKSKPKTTARTAPSPVKTQSGLPLKLLPSRLHPCLNAQKREILRTLYDPASLFDADEDTGVEKTANKQLEDLLKSTIVRSEGNSCLLLGPRGSGKSKILDQCLKSLPEPPIIIRLSGWIHHTDRLAMREIAYQLGQQTGKSFLQAEDDEEDVFVEQDDNPFLDQPNPEVVETGLALPPPSHLPALISVIPTLSRPTVVILDAFDLFALHPRQALLYCLLDTVQGCRTGRGNKGLAVVGMTARIDTINLLEKRVKSRFSGRVIRATGISTTHQWLSLTKKALCPEIPSLIGDEDLVNEWNDAWKQHLSELLEDRGVVDMIKDMAGLAKDLKLLFRILIYAVVRLSPDSAFLSPSLFSQATLSQRSRPSLYDSIDLPYPALCLLIASIHSITSGHDIFTFEMLFSTFRNQLRASVAAPVQVNGGSIGMARCSKATLLSAFEHLTSCQIFVAAAASSNTMAKEFTRYRTTLERGEVRRIVEKTGQVTLKKWLNKAE